MRCEKKLEMLHNVKAGDIVTLAIRLDARHDYNDFLAVKTVRALVIGLYNDFVLIMKPFGVRECFSWRDFERMRRKHE